jgi:uncharacterized membrane protein
MVSLKSFKEGNLSFSSTIHEWLLVSSCFSCLLLAGRMIATYSLGYIFLPWNLFLAFVPYWISWWMTRNVSIIQNKIKLLLSLAGWLLFIPNSFYIITDLFHFTHIRSAPQWFDLLLIFSFAWNGILCGIISLRRVEIILSLLKGKEFSLFIIFVVMWLSSFGIYIGRYLRYNSWDIISDPFSLLSEIAGMVFHPFDNLWEWGMISCYSIFMTLLYITLKKLSESFTTKK